jgi:4'-phosphopantetheinyl transferase EntD
MEVLDKIENKFFEECYCVNSSQYRGVFISRCEFNSAYYNRNMFENENILFPPSLNNAVKSRQAEYLAGRFVARRAIYKLGFQGVDIPSGKHREPIWPGTVAASIAHTSSSAISVAMLKKEYRSIGVDVENWINPLAVEDIKTVVLQKTEESYLRKCDMEFHKVFTLTFSAKESLFKALFPSVGYYFDFSAAELTSLSLTSGTFVLTLRQTLTKYLTSGTRFTGHFEFDTQGVTSLIVA